MLHYGRKSRTCSCSGALAVTEERSGGKALSCMGLLHCRPCRCAMTPSQTRKGTRHYRYYTCCAARKRGWRTCPSKAVPAEKIEQFVLEQIHQRGCQIEGHAFTVAWEKLSSVEQAEVVTRWIEGIEYDGADGTVAITFHTNSSQSPDEHRPETMKEMVP